MDFDELKERYRGLSLPIRLLLVFLLLALPVGYLYWEETSSLDESLFYAKNDLLQAKAQFERANDAFQQRGELEEKKIYTEQQLTRAREKLPDSFDVDLFLRKSATIASEVGVLMNLFDPNEERCGNSQVNHKELPISVGLRGRYNQIASFIDRIVHLDISVTASDVKVIRAPIVGGDLIDLQSRNGDRLPTLEEAQRARKDLRLDATLELVLYKSAAEGECSGRASE